MFAPVGRQQLSAWQPGKGSLAQTARHKGYGLKGTSKGLDLKGSDAKGFDPISKGYGAKGTSKGPLKGGVPTGTPKGSNKSYGQNYSHKGHIVHASSGGMKGAKGAGPSLGTKSATKGSSKSAWSGLGKRALEPDFPKPRSAKARRAYEVLDAEIGQGPDKGIGASLAPIVGTWLKAGCDVEISEEGYLHWRGFADDSVEEPTPIRAFGGGQFAITFDGEEFFTCEILAAGMELSWSDGDVWKRSSDASPQDTEHADLSEAALPRVVPGKGRMAIPKVALATPASAAQAGAGKPAAVGGLRLVLAAKKGPAVDDSEDWTSTAPPLTAALESSGLDVWNLLGGQSPQPDPVLNEASAGQTQPWKIDQTLASLDGPWRKTVDNCTVTIYDGYVHWDHDATSGEDPPEPTRLENLESGLFQMHFDDEADEVFTGQLEHDGHTLVWSDGEVWQRVNDQTQESGEVLVTF